jgi:hypothetical protein
MSDYRDDSRDDSSDYVDNTASAYPLPPPSNQHDSRHDHFSSASSQHSASHHSLQSSSSVVRDSVAPGKKWVWDEWDENGGPDDYSRGGTSGVGSRSTNVRSVVGGGYDDDTLGDGTLGTITTAKYEQIRTKVATMRKELEEKRQEVDSLKASVARKKLSDQRIIEQIEKSWEDRLSKRSKEHKAAITRHTDFIEQLTMSNQSIIKRKEGLEEVLKYKKANLTPAVETARRENAEKLKEAREEWLHGEKVRLAKLADAKSSELKKDAVKALEPELQRLISGNKLDLEQREKQLMEQFESFVAEKEREGELQMQEEFLKIEKEAEKEAEAIRRQQSSSLMTLTTQQEDDMKKARDMWKRDMEQERSAFEVERRRRVSGYNAELEDIRQTEADRMSRFLQEHEAQLASLQQQKQDAMEQRQENMAEQMQNWQRERLMQLRQEQHVKDESARRALREQSEAELGMVLAKLEAQTSEERNGIEGKVQSQLENYTMNLRKEEERLCQEEQTLMGRFAQEHEKVQSLQEEVSMLESRVVGMERRVASTEDNLKQERGKTNLVKTDCGMRMEALAAGKERSVELASHEVTSLQKQLEDLKTTAVDCGPVQEKELARLQNRCARELQDVEDRVRLVIERKDAALKEKELELKDVVALSKELTAELDEFRRRDINAGGE